MQNFKEKLTDTVSRVDVVTHLCWNLKQAGIREGVEELQVPDSHGRTRSLGWFPNLDLIETICFDHYANEA